MVRSRAAVVAVGAAALLGIVGWGVTGPGPADPAARLAPGARVAARVVDVVDGDTITVAWDGRIERVRLLGIDTPETVHPRRTVECFGPEAAADARRRMADRTVHLEFDVERRDRYGRLLAHVHVDGRHVNEDLVRAGVAEFQIFLPNQRHARRILAAELEARAQRRGLWGACR